MKFEYFRKDNFIFIRVSQNKANSAYNRGYSVYITTSNIKADANNKNTICIYNPFHTSGLPEDHFNYKCNHIKATKCNSKNGKYLKYYIEKSDYINLY